MTAVSASIEHNNALRPIILQCAKVSLGETSEYALENFNETIEEGKEHVTDLKNAVESVSRLRA